MVRRTLTVVLALVLSAGVGTADARPKTLATGFLDGGVQGLPGPEAAQWFTRAVGVGASVSRIAVNWSAIAPIRPPDGEARNPFWTGYSFGKADAQIAAAQQAGLQVMLSVSGAPAWAEGANRSGKRVGRGSWMPDAAAYEQFMQAVAARYAGSVPGLPRVDRFQVWNEPNLNLYLAPQYDSDGRAFAAARFRDLVNAAYRGVNAARSDALVAAGGLAPYGDPGTNGYRSRPVAFLRAMLCLGKDLKRTCGERTSVDAISLHPYAVADPSRSASSPDDATIPDWKRITRVLRAARRAGTLGPKFPQQWVTEVSYDSSPPDPEGVPSKKRARYVSEMLYLLWRQNVNLVTWYLLRDQLPQPNYASTYQSGMFLYDGTEKPDAVAFKFPTWIAKKSRRSLRVWWRSPVAGPGRMQVRRGGHWKTVKRVTAKASGVGITSVPRRRTSAVRVVLDDGTRSYQLQVRR